MQQQEKFKSSLSLDIQDDEEIKASEKPALKKFNIRIRNN